MKRRTIKKTRQLLEQEFNITCIDGKFYQDKPKKGLKELKIYTLSKEHKYGKTLSYQYIEPYNYTRHKAVIMTYHSFLYAWHKGEVPEGYDVDHIDGDTLNNDISNLQLLTREENLAKRSGSRNQYGGSQPIYCIELDKEYTGMYQAAKELGLRFDQIKFSLIGKQPKKVKYHFKYVEEKK